MNDNDTPDTLADAPEVEVTRTDEKDYELLRLENQLCFALYAATRALTKTYREKLTPYGLTYPQYLVLIVLWEEDGATISTIGRKLMLDSGTLTPLVKRLESQGLVERRRGVADEREVNVHLTRAGKAIKDKALDARCFVACRLGMSESDILELRADLMAMIERLERSSGDAAEPWV